MILVVITFIIYYNDNCNDDSDYDCANNTFGYALVTSVIMHTYI